MIDEMNCKRQSLIKLIGDVFVHCGKAMNQLIEYPRLLFPALLQFLAPLLFFILSFKLYVPYVQEMQGVKELTEAQNMARIGMIVGALTNVLMWLCRSLIIFLALKGFKTNANFKQVLVITGFSYLVIVLMLLIMCIAGQFTGELYINFSLAVFFQNIKGTYLYGFLRGFCIFMIWEYVLIGVGCWKLTKSKKIFVAVLATFLLQIFINMPNARFM